MSEMIVRAESVIILKFKKNEISIFALSIIQGRIFIQYARK